MEKYFEAIDFAEKAHWGQYRKGNRIPYIIHPLSVMEILIRNNAKEEVVIAGILHDVVEDTNYTLDDINEKFGDEVAKLVECASELEKNLPWEQRKQHTIDFLQTVKDKDILYLICADKLHNVTSMKADYEKIGDELWTKFKHGREKQKWYYKTIAEIFLKYDSEDKLFYEYMNEVKIFFGE